MIIFIVGLIAEFIYIFLEKDNETIFYRIVSGLGGGLFAGVLAWVIIGGIIGIFFPTEYKIDSSTNICALNDTNFFLTSSNTGYKYVVETFNGKQIKEINNTDFYIKEDSGTPRIEELSVCYTHFYDYLFGHPYIIQFLKGDRVNIYVPEGSVTTDYNIDLIN